MTKQMQIKAATIAFFAMALTAPLVAGSHLRHEDLSFGKVDLQVRTRHAKELLGTHYRKSAARLYENDQELSRRIHQKLQRRLPKSFQAQTALITRTLLVESRRHGLDPVFVLAVIQTESSFNPLVRGSFGEIGLMQIKPDTAAWISQKEGWSWAGDESLENPMVNLRLGIAYLGWLKNRFPSRPAKYVTAYNMGPGNLRRLLASNIEPREYKSKVMQNYRSIYQQMTDQKKKKPLKA